MRVKKIYQNWASIPSYFLQDSQRKKEEYQMVDTSDYDLDLDVHYVVYGITTKDNFIWYYLCDYTSSDYPTWKPSPLLEVVDPRLSRYWIYNYREITTYPIITFPEWANNHPDFYDKLTDWEKSELAIFAKYKELMDLEFEDPNVTEAAQKEEGNWLICRSCFEAWEFHNHQDALVRCPQCKKVLNNPYYNR